MKKTQHRVWATLAVLTALFVVLSAGTSLALDLNPPDWRGLPDTTVQGWDFNVSFDEPTPDWGTNPYGGSIAFVTPGPSPYDQWLEEYDDMVGVWPLSGEIYVEVPNTPYDQLREKLIWVQLTWQPEPGAVVDFPIVAVVDALPLTFPLPLSGTAIATIPAGFGDWQHTTFLIPLPENPEWEAISITGEIFVDELVIDTYCVPEPSTMTLAVLGLAGLVGIMIRRRRR